MRSWDELASLGDAAPRDEALVVARAMMRAVARNADVLIERLRQRGWPVKRHARMPPGRLTSDRNAFTGEPRTLAFPDLDGHLHALSAIAGPVPVALEAFWREVGGVAFWADIEGPRPAWARAFREQDERAFAMLSLPELWLTLGARPSAPMTLEIDGLTVWPDEDEPVAIVLPDHPLDPIVRNVPGAPRFVSYLRNAFAWAGLPGLAYVERSAQLEELITELTDGLEPF